MPQGVSRDFIDLLYEDAVTARTRIIISGVLLAILLGLGLWLWLPWGGAVHVAAGLGGLLIGWAIAARTVGHYELSLRGQWARWMQLAGACDHVAELGRKVQGKRATGRPYFVAAALTILWALEVILIALAFDSGASDAMVASVVAANGGFIGAMLGHQLRLRSWSRQFAASLSEMVKDGEVSVWGVR